MDPSATFANLPDRAQGGLTGTDRAYGEIMYYQAVLARLRSLQ